MQQIAQLAGVSRMAVSLALRGSPKVSAKTAQRIREIAEELGYRPNPLVSALMTQLRMARPAQRPTAIAYVTAFPSRDGWRRASQHVHYFAGAQQRCETLGYHLEEWWLREPGMTEHRVGDILFNRGIHGVLVAPLPPGGAAMQFDWRKFSGATIGYSLTEVALHRAASDPFHSTRLAVQELTRLGYRRPGLALTREEDAQVEQRWSAALLAHQAEIAPELRVPILRTEDAFGERFVAWFREHRPDAVLSLSSECVALLAGVGVRVPKDAGFAHLARTPGDGDCAGVDSHAELIGAAAIDLVDVQLRRNELGLPAHRKTVLIGGAWVAGDTLREQTKRRRERATA